RRKRREAPIEERRSVSAQTEERLLHMVVALVADLASGRNGHHHELAALTGEEHASKILVRSSSRDDVHLVRNPILLVVFPPACVHARASGCNLKSRRWMRKGARNRATTMPARVDHQT